MKFIFPHCRFLEAIKKNTKILLILVFSLLFHSLVFPVAVLHLGFHLYFLCFIALVGFQYHVCKVHFFLVYVARSGKIVFDVLRDHFCLPIALIPTTAAIRDAPENSDISVRAVYSCPESHVICNFYVGLIFDDEQKKAVEGVQKALCFQKQVRCVSF